MAKQLNVNLAFTADTSKATQQLRQLQTQLNDLIMSSGKGASSLGLTEEISKAISKTTELKIALESAINPKTGTLDLGKFNDSLKQSGTRLAEYANHLNSLGPAGQQAFAQLANSINQASIPLRRSSNLLTEFATTLKNTARWQISSSILHGFMGSIQSAFGYAKDLNKSLNDIRIVTGQNVDQMHKFAVEANNAAKSLSTTTTEYTKASLIYYQQGLSDKEVQERTDATIKMANVTGQSAEIVSDQMTAIWNNFAKGGENLEYYADVITALGAATASSSDEIAQGLEKFASVADTVGLSYEYATAALATVTATTRQSADVVGTAFKTLFARIQDLELGKTLDDGTTLGSYSEALAKVGIHIKDATGNLRDMDSILNDMGSKWDTLNKDQQVALAQNVAGVRQYTQLMALMENWDFMKQNIDTATNASGKLQEQAEIYEESWEAASKRVKSALEDIYDSLLNDEFFIKLTDGFSKFLNLIGDTIDGIGGMQGAFSLLGVIITRVFAKDISASLSRFAYNIQSFTQQGRQNLINQAVDTKKQVNTALRNTVNDGSVTGTMRASVNISQANIQDKLIEKSEKLLANGRQLSEVEQKIAGIMLDQARAIGDQVIQTAQLRENSEATANSLERQLRTRISTSSHGNQDTVQNFNSQIKSAKALQTEFTVGEQLLIKFRKQLTGISDGGKTQQNLIKYFEDFIIKAKEAKVDVSNLKDILNNLKNANGAKEFVDGFETELMDLGVRAQGIFDDIQQEAQEMANAGRMNPQQLRSFIQTLEQLQQEYNQTGTLTEKQVALLKDLELQVKNTDTAFDNFHGVKPTVADGIVALGNTISSISMAITSFMGLIDTWNNEDMSFGEKLLATFTTLGMVIPIVTTAFRQQNLVQMSTLSSSIAVAFGFSGEAQAAVAAGTATAGFGATLYTVLWPIGLVMLAIGAVVAVVWGLVKAFKALNGETPEEKLKRTKEEAASLKESLNEVKTAADELKNSFNEYDEIQDKLAKCKKGTDEWTQALKENNDKVLELMDKYPELTTMIKDGETAINLDGDGKLTIADWAIKDLTLMVNEKLGVAKIASNTAEQRVRNLDIEQKQNERDRLANQSIYSDWITYESGSTDANRIKNMVARTRGYYDRNKYRVEPAKYPGQSPVYSERASISAQHYAEDIINKYGLNATTEQIKTSLEGLDIAEQKKVEKLIQSEQELEKAIRENTQATKIENAAAANEMLSGIKEYDESKYKNLIMQVIGENMTEGTAEASTTYAEGMKNVSTREEYWQRYAEEKGIDSSHGYNNLDIDYGDDGTVTYSYIDDEGKEQERKASVNMIGDVLSAQDATTDNLEYGQFITSEINTYKNKDQAELFAASVSGNRGLLSDDLLQKNDKQVNQIINSMEISEEVLEKLNYDVGENGEKVEEARAQFKKYQKELVDSKKAFNQLKENGLTALAGITTAFKANGKEIDKWPEQTKEAAYQISKDLSKALGADSDLGLSPEFIAENAEIIEDFINDVEGSGARLQEKLQESAIVNVTANIQDEEIKSKINTIHQNLITLADKNWEVGVGLDPTKEADFYAACQNMIDAAGMTAEQAQEYFGKMGYDVTFKKDKKKVSEIVWNKKYINEYDPKTGDLISTEVDATPKVIEGEIEVPAIETITPNGSFGGNIESINDGGNLSPKESGDGGGDTGGGGSKPKSTKEARQKKSDTVERYKEINDQLAKTQRLMDKNSALADTLWGPDKVEKIQENIDALETYNKQLEQKIQLQKQYLAEDRTELTNAASAVGLNFQFGEDGTILNYTTEMTKLHNQREALLDSFGATINENEQKKLDALDEKIEAVTSAYETYEETLNEGFELDQEKLDKQIEQMQLRFEKLELKIEIQVELNENDIADIEHKLERLGDSNVYSAAERIVLIQQNASSYKNIANAQMDGIKEAEELYSAGKITQSDYMARLQEGKEALQEAEMSIRDGIAQIGDELENTFDLVDEKLDQQFTKFDQMIELMEHYKNVVSLTQGEASYKEFNEILKASQKVLRDRIAAGESEVAMWEARRKDLETQIATLPEGEAKREAEEALQAIMEKEANAKSQLMADIEQLGEYAREIFENSIEQAVIDFENKMFGKPLSSVIEGIEMMNARQEELLTTTNKIYETNKLIRNVEKDIEATSNTRAKQALAEFQNKVKQKQEQNELTKFELDLLNAEYEITKAQIALEEAQNAKDTVRLTRDSEGNFGYVYTANEDKVADAEQALDDATNNYYNTAMEGAQKYQDQIYQHIEEWEEKVKEIYLDQTLSEEEKNAKIKEINDTYNTLITQDKELYYMAVGAMQESSYNNQVDYDLKGIKSAENWYDHCNQFLKDLEDAQDEYDKNTKEVVDHTEENFGTMEDAIDNTKQASEDLKDQIVDDLVPELNTTLKDAIENATNAWLEYIKALKEVIRLTDEAMGKNKNAKENEIKESESSEDNENNDQDKKSGNNNTNNENLPAQNIEPQIGDSKHITEDAHYSGNGGKTAPTNRTMYLVEKLDSTKYKYPYGISKTKGGTRYGWVSAFDTGGYTGQWGPEGKLAMLHQKELVLNAEDTENFLLGIKMLRSISDILERNAALASMTSSNLSAYTLSNSFGQTLEQEVTIHAEFPNVSDHNEIEIAIDNLINRASQYSYKS